ATSGYLGHYQPAKHALRVLRRADVRPDLERAALGQEFIHQASAVIILTCIARRIEERYGKSRGARYIAMEAGHAAQNVMLQAVALGLASVPIGAFQDAQIAKILELGPEERPLYMLAVGRAG
ncbi:MAG: SagB/ThcOx family dehydrogenase, partial [Chloroflexi bacterium]|nr:SagB/ThcOx family dehydrogenase [Chloroflexota bacterium]